MEHGFFTGLGEKDKAFERLEKAYDDRSTAPRALKVLSTIRCVRTGDSRTFCAA
jgi:hypothetical protein